MNTLATKTGLTNKLVTNLPLELSEMKHTNSVESLSALQCGCGEFGHDDEWHPECAFHFICSVLQFTDGSPFILLAPNSYNWVSKCMGPHIRASPCWEGIWAALLAGRECVCRVHQSLPSPGELNKLIGRLVAASSRHCGPYSSQQRAQKVMQWTSWKAGLRQIQSRKRGLAYSLNRHFHILLQHTTEPPILKST